MKQDLKIRKELTKYGHKIVDKGLVAGAGGNISARSGDIIYVSPSGFALDEIEEKNFIEVDICTGQTLKKGTRPTCEIIMHLSCYLIRQDIKAIIHTHQSLATGIASAGIEFKPMLPDFVAIVGDVPIIDFILPATKALADAVAGVIKNHNACLLANHGCITVGATLKEAFYRADIIEDAAKSLVVAMAVGKPRFYTDEEQQAIKNLEAENYRLTILKR